MCQREENRSDQNSLEGEHKIIDPEIRARLGEELQPGLVVKTLCAAALGSSDIEVSAM